MFTFLFIQLHISLYNVLPEAFVVCKHIGMTSLLVLWKPTYPQRFELICELWVFYDGEDLGHPYALPCFVIFIVCAYQAYQI